MIASPPMGTRFAGDRFALGALLLSLAAAAHPAAAQYARDPLAAARAELDAARFAEAVRLYDQLAAADTGLDRDSLVRLLGDRALARNALRDTAGARADLQALFAIDPDATFGEEAPPSFSRLASEVRASSSPLSLQAEASTTPNGFEVRCRVSGDPANLVRSVRVLALRDGDVQTYEGPVAVIPGSGELRYAVEAVSWGGAVVARLGTATEPRTVGSAVLAPVAASGGDDTPLWIGLGIGAGVAVAIAVVLTIFFTTTSDVTQPGIPMEIP